MIEKVAKRLRRGEYDEVQENLKYWLSKSPDERVAAVEILRRQFYGDLPRLQRVGRRLKRT